MRGRDGDCERAEETVKDSERRGKESTGSATPVLWILVSWDRFAWRNSAEYVVRLNVVFECTRGQVDVLSVHMRPLCVWVPVDMLLLGVGFFVHPSLTF